MITFVAIIHIIACLGLIGLVLIQDSKGGGVFNSQSSSNSVLGAGGATSLAQTMTKVVAAIFAATCIVLSIMSATSSKSVIDTMTPAAATSTTTAPTETSTTTNAVSETPKDAAQQAQPAGQQPTAPATSTK